MRPPLRSFVWNATLVAVLLFAVNRAQAAQGTTERVSVDSAGNEADSHSFDPSISDDGRFVAFSSAADNLISGDANRFADIFLHDRETAETSLVSLNTTGLRANKNSSRPSISGDGRFIVFESDASNLV